MILIILDYYKSQILNLDSQLPFLKTPSTKFDSKLPILYFFGG